MSFKISACRFQILLVVILYSDFLLDIQISDLVLKLVK